MSGLILLQISLRVRKMAGLVRISTANGAFMEVPFKDITPRKRIPAENAHIWVVAGV